MQREEEEAKKKQLLLKAKQEMAKRVLAENSSKAKEVREKAKQDL